MSNPITPPHIISTVSPLPMTGTSQAIPRLKTQSVEVIQLSIPAGKDVPLHRMQGEVILHCLEGEISLFLRTGGAAAPTVIKVQAGSGTASICAG